MSEIYGGVASNFGSAAEVIFYNSLTFNFEIGGIKFDRVTPNVMPATKTKQGKFDNMLVNGNSVAVVEVNYKLHPSDLAKTTKNLKRYREFYPEHKNYKPCCGITGFSVAAYAVQAAKKQGLFVLKRGGKVLKTDAKKMWAFG